MLGALIAIPVMMCVLSFVIGVIIDHRKMTFYGYGLVLFVLALAVGFLMVDAWVPLLEAYVNAQ